MISVEKFVRRVRDAQAICRDLEGDLEFGSVVRGIEGTLVGLLAFAQGAFEQNDGAAVAKAVEELEQLEAATAAVNARARDWRSGVPWRAT